MFLSQLNARHATYTVNANHALACDHQVSPRSPRSAPIFLLPCSKMTSFRSHTMTESKGDTKTKVISLIHVHIGCDTVKSGSLKRLFVADNQPSPDFLQGESDYCTLPLMVCQWQKSSLVGSFVRTGGTKQPKKKKHFLSAIPCGRWVKTEWSAVQIVSTSFGKGVRTYPSSIV
jgi:hypothetical protein